MLRIIKIALIAGLLLFLPAQILEPSEPAESEGKGEASLVNADDIPTVPASRVCMTQDDVYDRDLMPIPVEGKTYYGCCMGCVNAIKKEARFRFAIDPVSGEKVDKADALIYNYNGKALYFTSKENLSMFVHEPERYMKHDK